MTWKDNYSTGLIELESLLQNAFPPEEATYACHTLFLALHVSYLQTVMLGLLGNSL